MLLEQIVNYMWNVFPLESAEEYFVVNFPGSELQAQQIHTFIKKS